ncbi:MAG: ACT domain-containing protein, partial [Leucobacter sp.]|nr:ACT domain-containing protein [Leucobacter sp.]
EGKNAVFVEAEAAGELMFYGAGAGGNETASAVLGDLVSAARRHVVGGPGIPGSTHAEFPVLPVGEVMTAYQVMLEVRDEPGVLARVAGILAAHGVSAASVEQNISDEGRATLVIGTHTAREADLAATVGALRADDAVAEVTSVLRREGRA